ncbi:MAG TPA: TonB-dependent receptor plug domain-containing protein, partial [Candidatus Synoicihabitans sp.]|nr:TonB-dependent receptor plug domain-containing protein [Candidatus Synoicihabitans sp.]
MSCRFLPKFGPSLHRVVLAAVATAAAATTIDAQSPTSPAGEDDDAFVAMDQVTVSAATRTEKLASALPVTTTVVNVEALDRQLAISTDLGSALAQAIPSYAPSRQKLTSSGESFRGRDPLYLIDGIPQSNPLRAGQRESSVIDPFFLERIEVVHGSSAAQGLGATGGIINFVTRHAPETDGVTHRAEISGTSADGFEREGFGGKAAYLLAARGGAVTAVTGVAVEHTPMQYDAKGRPLGVDNVQGDTLDSESANVFAKLGYDFSRRHSLELMVSHFQLDQNLRWVAVPGNRTTGLPTTSVRGTSRGEPAENRVTAAALTFSDHDLWGGELTLNVFRQDFTATYGASDTAATRNTFRVNGVPTLDQSQVEAEKYGLRSTWAGTLHALGGLGLVTGFDYLSDETAQVLILTGRTWVPYTTYKGWSPYVQLELPLGDVTLHGGVRAEFAELQVDDFTTIESAGSTFVQGGN